MNDVTMMATTPRHRVRESGWQMQIDRGPDWLFVRLGSPRDRDDGQTRSDLAEGIWEALRENHAHRVLLELDDAGPIDDALIAAIAALGSRVREQGGMIRLCGLSQVDLRMLRARGCTGDIAHFESRAEAIGTGRSTVPS